MQKIRLEVIIHNIIFFVTCGTKFLLNFSFGSICSLQHVKLQESLLISK
jgi:hypothetical protein